MAMCPSLFLSFSLSIPNAKPMTISVMNNYTFLNNNVTKQKDDSVSNYSYQTFINYSLVSEKDDVTNCIKHGK